MSLQKDTSPCTAMAVLVNGSTLANIHKRVVDPRIRLLAAVNKHVKLDLFYFSMSGVGIKERKIHGLYWDGQKKTWSQREFAFPDVILLRGGTGKKYSPLFNAFLKVLKSKNAKIINYPKFNKWILYQILHKDPVLQGYLPVTMSVKNPLVIKKMLEEFKTVYIKPHHGRKGKYVLRLEELNGGQYRYSYYQYDEGKLVNKTVYGFQVLLKIIYTFFQGKDILVQQAIELIKYETGLVDMRAELQRNGQGKLEITGISARLGKPNSPITTHGNAYSFDHFFQHKMHYPRRKVEELNNKVKEFLFRIYEYIEKSYGEYAEIGIDFAVDINDNIWLIECNSQSTKVSLAKAYGSKVLYNSYKTILEYAGYVTNHHAVPQSGTAEGQ